MAIGNDRRRVFIHFSRGNVCKDDKIFEIFIGYFVLPTRFVNKMTAAQRLGAVLQRQF